MEEQLTSQINELSTVVQHKVAFNDTSKLLACDNNNNNNKWSK